MPISREGKERIIVARFMRGKCGICHEMIMPGEAYEPCVGGTNSREGYPAHFNCRKPASVLTYEELKANK